MSKVFYRGAPDTKRGPSPIIWGDFPLLDVLQDPARGIHLFEDFVDWGGTVATNIGNKKGWKTYEDNGCSALLLAGVSVAHHGGVVRLTTASSDNVEVAIQSGGAGAGPFVISNTRPNALQLWFEARIRLNTVLDGKSGALVGLVLGNSPADSFMADDGTISDTSYIGFHRLEGDGDALDIVYRKAGQTQQTVKADAKVIAADTWYKVGFVYRPQAPVSRRITFYFDGAECNAYVTDADIAAATFPAAVGLAPLAAIKNATAAGHSLDVDWIRVGQLRYAE